MKKVIGIILLVLFFAFLYAGCSVLFYLGGFHWAVVAFAPLGIYVATGLIVAFETFVRWLLLSEEGDSDG